MKPSAQAKSLLRLRVLLITNFCTFVLASWFILGGSSTKYMYLATSILHTVTLCMLFLRIILLIIYEGNKELYDRIDDVKSGDIHLPMWKFVPNVKHILTPKELTQGILAHKSQFALAALGIAVTVAELWVNQ